MFGSACRFRDRKALADGWRDVYPDELAPPLLDRAALAAEYAPIVACDNFAGAADVYGYRLPAGGRPALVLGNERHGIAEDLRSLACGAVQIPMVSRRLDCINVAAAAAVALYYLSARNPAKLIIRGAPERRRPALLLVGGADHVELGSAIRSAAAFGWRSALVEDRFGAWFGVERGVRAEGRAAARRARNAIRLVPARSDQRYAFAGAVIVSAHGDGDPLRRADLAGGPNQVLVIGDEASVELGRGNLARFAQSVRFAHLELPASSFPYHFRLIASIALAEAARQVGRSAEPRVDRRPHGRLRYDRALDLLPALPGEIVELEELAGY